MTVTPDKAVSDVLPDIMEIMSTNLWTIEPLTDVQQCVIINSDIGNVPTGGVGIGWDFAMEQYYFNNPEEH